MDEEEFMNELAKVTDENTASSVVNNIYTLDNDMESIERTCRRVRIDREKAFMLYINDKEAFELFKSRSMMKGLDRLLSMEVPITVICPLCEKEYPMTASLSQLYELAHEYRNVQEIFPTKTAGERELLKLNGFGCDACWNKGIGEPTDDMEVE